MTIGSAISAAAAKGYILAGLFSCDVMPPPQVQIIFNNKPPVVTHNLNHQELEKFSLTTQVPKKADEIFVRGGMTESLITNSLDFSFQLLTMPITQKSCLSLREVNIIVDYSPTVHIASNYAAGSCYYNQTWLHELKHVNTDIITINEFIPYFQKAVQQTTNSLPTKGPFPMSETEAHQKEMNEKLTDTLRQATKAMQTTRQARQQTIDTRQEYIRLSNACIGKQ